MIAKPATPEAVELLHKGAVALAQVERVGIRVDEAYLDATLEKVGGQLKALEAELRQDEVWTVWRKRYREANLDSLPQLTEVLFSPKLLGLPYPEGAEFRTATGRYKADESALAGVDLPFVQAYLRKRKLDKLHGTYLKGIKREVVDGFLHPVYNLNTARTYRSSGSDPNFQNIPIRNPEIGKLVRSAFRARPGRRLVENDFGGIEVKVAACYNKDPALIRYVTDPTTDMHRDTAMELFCLTKGQVDKRTTRDWAKNRFVFPQFYGSVYFQCAPSLWEGVASGAAKVNGVSLLKHLQECGITALGACQPKQDPRPGTFESHVRKVERAFWDDRFRVYSEWKRSWYAQYLERGWLRMHTGFVCEGVFGRNDVINYPVQGSAFHCLLACLVEMVLIRLRRLKMRARVVGQIHDCILADVPDNEVQDYLDLVTEVMTGWLPKLWPWIIVPLTAEAEVTPVGGTWHEKEQWVKVNGTWGPKG